MKKLTLVFAALAFLTSSVFAQRETQFFSNFEYGSFDDEPFDVISPADLNGAVGQVGEWGGEDLPPTSGGDILPELSGNDEEVAGLVNDPYDGGRILLLDRPSGNIETGEDFKGFLEAQLAEPILLLGAEISFELGTRRTNGNHNKDYDIVGRGSDGSESFRLRVGTNSNSGERLGYVVGEDEFFDLDTVVGNDQAADLNNTGYNVNLAGPYPDVLGGPGVGAEFAAIKLSLSQSGFVIDLAHNDANNSVDANAYTSATLPFNGDATDLAVVEFGFSGSSATGRNSGWFLDDVLITGFTDILQGDFNSDGSLDVADFIILSDNFGTQTPMGDFDFDGRVTLADFAQLKAAFAAQAQEAATAVPEPSSLTLLALGFVGFVIRRRHR